jgi:hypothetical protein
MPSPLGAIGSNRTQWGIEGETVIENDQQYRKAEQELEVLMSRLKELQSTITESVATLLLSILSNRLRMIRPPAIWEQLLKLRCPPKPMSDDALEIHRYIQLHPQRACYQRHQARIADPRAKTSYK